MRRGESAFIQNSAQHGRIAKPCNTVETNLALVAQFAECRHRLLQNLLSGKIWRRACLGDWFVEVKNVHAITTQPAKAGINGLRDGAGNIHALRPSDAHLGAHNHLRAKSFQRAAQIAFGYAIAVSGCRIEIRDALVNGAANGAVLFGCGAFHHQAADGATTIA